MGFFDDLFEGSGRHGHRLRHGDHDDDHGYRRYGNGDHGLHRYEDGYARDDHEGHSHQPGYDPRAVQRILVCPSCGGENPVMAKFCMECGQPLRPSGPARSDVPEPHKP
ncbi:MAG: zinc ribbon domain-containing protein [Thermaceae bacterium]|nr:zinc ribbon domain-containing protein [Thermaceae bacterium]